MDYLELPAPPPLDAIVHCFWFLRGAEAAGYYDQTHMLRDFQQFAGAPP